jgi:hypothetical protein
MSGFFAEGFRTIAHHRLVIAFATPAVSLAITMPSLLLMPRGKAKGFITSSSNPASSPRRSSPEARMIPACKEEPSVR